MTTDVELPPLPERVEVDKHLPTGVRIYAYDANTLKNYARANVEHHTEALRSLYLMAQNHGVFLTEKLVTAEARAKHLEEALRHLRNHTSVNSYQIELIDTALHPTAAQEGN